MKDPDRHIIIVAGEPSGDIHGANLVIAMRRLDPSLTFCGIGGPRMAKAGVDLFFSIEHLSAMGLLEVIRQLKPIYKAFGQFRQHVLAMNPDLVILIDYPGFNLKAAWFAKHHSDAKIFYYIAPKVWAWKKSRLAQIKKFVDHVGLIFPFEEKLYKNAGIPATYVGNPLVDQYPHPLGPSEKTQASPSDPWVIGLLPGSRKNEITTLLAPMLAAAQKIQGHHPQVRFLVSAAESIPLERIETAVGKMKYPEMFQVIPGSPQQLFARADLLIAASGTVTLEAALCAIPTVIVYKMSPVTYRAARAVVKIKYAGLANIIVGEQVMPELLQHAATPENICAAVLDILDNLPDYTRKLSAVRKLLGTPGAAGRAAAIAQGLLHQHACDSRTNRCLTNHTKPY
jgi:lipid-A-disaccharide synthase